MHLCFSILIDRLVYHKGDTDKYKDSIPRCPASSNKSIMPRGKKKKERMYVYLCVYVWEQD